MLELMGQLRWTYDNAKGAPVLVRVVDVETTAHFGGFARRRWLIVERVDGKPLRAKRRTPDRLFAERPDHSTQPSGLRRPGQ